MPIMTRADSASRPPSISPQRPVRSIVRERSCVVCRTPLSGAIVVNPACSTTSPQRAIQACDALGQLAVERHAVDQLGLVAHAERPR